MFIVLYFFIGMVNSWIFQKLYNIRGLSYLLDTNLNFFKKLFLHDRAHHINQHLFISGYIWSHLGIFFFIKQFFIVLFNDYRYSYLFSMLEYVTYKPRDQHSSNSHIHYLYLSDGLKFYFYHIFFKKRWIKFFLKKINKNSRKKLHCCKQPLKHNLLFKTLIIVRNFYNPMNLFITEVRKGAYLLPDVYMYYIFAAISCSKLRKRKFIYSADLQIRSLSWCYAYFRAIAYSNRRHFAADKNFNFLDHPELKKIKQWARPPITAAFAAKFKKRFSFFKNEVVVSENTSYNISGVFNKNRLDQKRFLFLRCNNIYNKGRYSRNRQNYKTGVFWCFWLTIISIFGIYYFFYGFLFKFTYLWWLFFCFIISFSGVYFKQKKNYHWWGLF